MSPLPLSDILERKKEIWNKPRCLHPLAPEDCSDRIIAAHSVQKRVGLRAIEEDGHVLSFLSAIGRNFGDADAISPERIGVSRASTFRGFCEKHDAALFRPIETQKWHPTKDNAFLFSFRAVCYEYYAKLSAEEIGKWQKTWIDRGKDFQDQIADQQLIEDCLTGIRLGIADGEGWKRKYDTMYKSGDYTEYRFLSIAFRPALPLVSCGGIHIESDFNGRLLQKIISSAQTYEHMTLNITPLDDASIAVLGWAGEPNGPSYEFVASLLAQPSNRLSHAITRLAFESVENTFLRQDWWENLPIATQSAIRKRALRAIAHPADCLMEDELDLFQATASTTGMVL
jgi:hypothetical protein